MEQLINREIYEHINYSCYIPYDLIVVIYFAHKLLPAFGFYTPSIVYLAIFAILFLMSVRMKSKDISTLIPFIIVSVMECLDFLVGVKGSSIIIIFYGELQTLLFILIIFRYRHNSRKMERHRLFNIIIGMYVITAVTSIIGWYSYPEASRLLALGADAEMYSTYTKMNIGSFDFVYEMVLLTPLFIGMLKTNKIKKGMGTFLIVLTGIIAINSQYTTALLLYCLTLILLLPIKITPGKFVFIIIFGLLCIYFLPNLLSNLLFTVANNINSSIVSERLNYIAETLSGNHAESIAMESRMHVYKRALLAFMKSYGVGTWSSNGSGGHSFIFDNLGVYGYVGIFMIIIFLRGVFIISLKPFKSSDCYGYMFWSFIMTIILMFLNPKSNVFFLGTILLLFGLVMAPTEEDNETALESSKKRLCADST